MNTPIRRCVQCGSVCHLNGDCEHCRRSVGARAATSTECAAIIERWTRDFYELTLGAGAYEWVLAGQPLP